MKVEGLNIGLAVTGSFCTFEKLIPEVENLIQQNANVYPIFSTNAATMDTRFGKAEDWIRKFEEITGHSVIKTIADAEPIGPKGLIDILVIAPCTEKALKIQNYINLILIGFDIFYQAGAYLFKDNRLQCRNTTFQPGKISIIIFFIRSIFRTALLGFPFFQFVYLKLNFIYSFSE